MKYISKENFLKFLERLKEKYDVYAPVKKGDKLFYKKYGSSSENIVTGEVRAFEPLKVFFTKAREKVAVDFKPETPGSENKPLAIVGVKACDLKGFKIQDHVFNDHDCEDPFYMRNRRQNLIISADCTSCIDSCFCLAMGVKPYPESDFDINLSEVNKGFIIKAGSPTGEEIIKKHSDIFDDTEDSFSERDAIRAKVTEEVKESIRKNSVPEESNFEGMVERNFDSKMWEEEAAACVECGACNTICPTCHCFLLYDGKDGKNSARLKIWDSCLIKDFARVAGGANPRPNLWMRLRNRFEKKFDYFPKVAGVYACTGCGRCISACPAKIDIRKVLKRLVNNE